MPIIPEVATRDKPYAYSIAGKSKRDDPPRHPRKRASDEYVLHNAAINKWWSGFTTGVHIDQKHIEDPGHYAEVIDDEQEVDITIEQYFIKSTIDDLRGYIQLEISPKQGALRVIDTAKAWSGVLYPTVGRRAFEWPEIAGESAEERFRRLAQQWSEESAFMSSITDMVMLPSYQKIIGMGWAAVAFMLEDLKIQPRHWFWALRAITDIDPVPPDDAGHVRRMTEAWVNWGRKNLIIE